MYRSTSMHCHRIISAGLLSLALMSPYYLAAAHTATDSRGKTAIALRDQTMDEAYQLLAKTDVLESAYVGFTLSRSKNLEALMNMLETEPDARARMQKLFFEGSMSGKMYALIGLQIIDEEEAARLLSVQLESNKAEFIKTYDGCVLNMETVEQALQKIEKGVYRESFQDAWQGNSQHPL